MTGRVLVWTLAVVAGCGTTSEQIDLPPPLPVLLIAKVEAPAAVAAFPPSAGPADADPATLDAATLEALENDDDTAVPAMPEDDLPPVDEDGPTVQAAPAPVTAPRSPATAPAAAPAGPPAGPNGPLGELARVPQVPGAPQGAPPPPTRDAATLLDRAVAWQGGRDRLAAIRNVKLNALKFTLHGANPGEANEGWIRFLWYGIAAEGQPDRVRFKVEHGAGSRLMGFDGKLYWMARDTFNGFLAPERPDEAADIERLDQARDILRVLLLPALMADGEKFEWKGTTRGKAGPGLPEEVRHILQKKDAKGRRVSVHLRDDGTILEAHRTETRMGKDAKGQPQPEVQDWVVQPTEWVEVKGVRLPRRIEVQVNRQLVLTGIAGDEKSPGYDFPEDAGRVYEKPEPKPK